MTCWRKSTTSLMVLNLMSSYLVRAGVTAYWISLCCGSGRTPRTGQQWLRGSSASEGEERLKLRKRVLLEMGSSRTPEPFLGRIESV